MYNTAVILIIQQWWILLVLALLDHTRIMQTFLDFLKCKKTKGLVFKTRCILSVVLLLWLISAHKIRLLAQIDIFVDRKHYQTLINMACNHHHVNQVYINFPLFYCTLNQCATLFDTFNIKKTTNFAYDKKKLIFSKKHCFSVL